MSRRTMMAWRPHDAAAWERETAECSLAGRGALVSLADALWRSEVGPCAVPDDDATLALWCRARREWAAVAPDVRLVLAPHPTLPGMLTWPWLLGVWEAQQAAYARRATAGSRGGKAKAARSNATPVAAPSSPDNASPAGSIATALDSIATPPTTLGEWGGETGIASPAGSIATRNRSPGRQDVEGENNTPPADAEGRVLFSPTPDVQAPVRATAATAPPPSAPEGRAAARSRLASPTDPPEPLARILAAVLPAELRPPDPPAVPHPPAVPIPSAVLRPLPRPLPLDPRPLTLDVPHVARP